MTRFPKPPITPNIIPVARVPRSFNTGRMLVIVTLFAILFSLLQTLDAPAALYPFAGVFTAAIVLGQMFLFHGEQPRVASLLVGACLMPVLSIGFVIAMVVTGEARFNIGDLVCVGVSSIFFGGFLGYLIGTVCAGAFLIVDRRWDAGQPLPQPPILAEIVPDEEQQAAPSDSTSPPDPWWQANDA